MSWLRLGCASASLFMCLAMTSCGGSGSSGTSTGGTPSASTTGSTGTSITVATSNAASSSQPAAVTIVSAVDQRSAGSPLQLPDAGSTESRIVLALDSQKQIVAAGFAPLTATSSLSLTAQTTADALARIAIGAVPTGTTDQSLVVAIEGTADFQSLVQAITTAANNGTLPGNSTQVIEALTRVISESTAKIGGPSTAAARLTRAQGALSSLPQVTTALPMVLYQGSVFAKPGALFVNGPSDGADLLQTQGVSVGNQVGTVWEAATTDLVGNALQSGVLITPGTWGAAAFTDGQGRYCGNKR